jgi:hypothetical protein
MRNEAWQRALDVQMDYHKWCSGDGGKLYNYFFFEDILKKAAEGFSNPPDIKEEDVEKGCRILTYQLVDTLWQADTMFVTSDMLHLMMQAAEDLPDDAVVDDHIFVTKTGFMLLEEPIVGTDRHGDTVMIDALTWFVERVRYGGDSEPTESLILYMLVDPGHTEDAWNLPFREIVTRWNIGVPPLTLQHFYPIRIGNNVPILKDERAEPGREIVAQAMRLFVAMNLIAQQKIGEPVILNPDRAQRKRAQRYFHGDERLITLITLRRKNVKHDNEEPQKVEWSRRWAVRGHWRKQWYPKSQTHDYVYIHEYIKGPEDKPFIASERRIFDFRR